MEGIQDIYNRKFKKLRLSLLDHCNFNCSYCTMGSDNVASKPQQKVDFFVKRVAKLHQHLQLDSIRLTGGEPLLYHELDVLIHELKKLDLPEITLTTNGFLLAKQASKLKNAGLDSINISLDAIDELTFQKISKRKKVEEVLNGIETAIKEGLNVKLNAVIMKGINEQEILPLLKYAFDLNIPIRFLELMAMGHLHEQAAFQIFTKDEILASIAQHYQFTRVIRKTSATANYWQTKEGSFFGIIANESTPFCYDCNRLRMDAQGNLFGCLSSNKSVYMTDEEPEELLKQKLQYAMKQKQSLKFTGSSLSMLEIGG
ncbi:cyclic pyranopterin monophosphate synthase [Pedobacter glucosidilyticus]|nr:GTP 3',8-cyclase MoaA [Pedobacter glucosidilyticus]KHJ37610.1 cyclic pyranopterin monophosphate synthase [Pedobacter glucosidilyticus]